MSKIQYRWGRERVKKTLSVIPPILIAFPCERLDGFVYAQMFIWQKAEVLDESAYPMLV